MSIVAGVDFGTLSVRVTLVDTQAGRLGSGTADYPLHRTKADPDFATQSHDDHMRALAEATHKALDTRACPAIRSLRLPLTPQAPALFRSARILSRSANIIYGATIALGVKPRSSPKPPIERVSKPSSGVVAPIPRSGAFPNCFIGSAAIPRSGTTSSLLSNIATWSPEFSAVTPIPRTSLVPFAPWVTSGCGTQSSVDFLRKNFLSPLTHC